MELSRWSGFSNDELEWLLGAVEFEIMCSAPGEGDEPDSLGPLHSYVVTMVRELRLELVARNAMVFSAEDLDEAGNLVDGGSEVLAEFNAGVVGEPQAIEASWRFINERWGEGLRSRR